MPVAGAGRIESWGTGAPDYVGRNISVFVNISGQTILADKTSGMTTTIYTLPSISGGIKLIDYNNNRISLIVQNLLSGDIYIRESPLQSGEGLKIVQDGSYNSDSYQGILYGYAVISGNKVVVMEESL